MLKKHTSKKSVKSPAAASESEANEVLTYKQSLENVHGKGRAVPFGPGLSAPVAMLTEIHGVYYAGSETPAGASLQSFRRGELTAKSGTLTTEANQG